MPQRPIEMTLREFLLRVLQQQYRVMREQVPVILEDSDPEPLHDFRVAARRSRSALSQLKSALEPDTTASLMADYRALSDSTNRLRDFDVFIEAFHEYKGLLPKDIRSAASNWFKRIRRIRDRESRAVLKFFRSPEFSKRMEHLDIMVNGPELPSAGADSLEPSSTFASRVIADRYRKVIDQGSSIIEQFEGSDPGSFLLQVPDSSMHRLRIRCKKLRYMVEFVRDRHPAETIDAIIGRMKNLQDLLGLYNDLSIQSAIIRNEVAATGNHLLPDADVTGALLDVLLQKKFRLFQDFASEFAAFAGEPVRKLFSEIAPL